MCSTPRTGISAPTRASSRIRWLHRLPEVVRWGAFRAPSTHLRTLGRARLTDYLAHMEALIRMTRDWAEPLAASPVPVRIEATDRAAPTAAHSSGPETL